MIDKKPTTYNEIVRLKKCYKLTQCYSNITENLFNEIYDFLGKSPDNNIVANQELLSFVGSGANVVKTVPLTAKNFGFDKITLNDSGIVVTPHYNPSSSYSSWGGSSGNNNNNNNNNNNR